MSDKIDQRNETFENNQAAIRDAVLLLLKEKKRKPTKREICEHTGLSYPTVRKHLRELDKRGFGSKHHKKDNLLRTLTDDVKLSIYNSAMKGNPAAMKLWLQVMEGFTEKTESKVEANVKVDNAPPVVVVIE